MMSHLASRPTLIATFSAKLGRKTKCCWKKQRGRRILMLILTQHLPRRSIRSIHHRVLSFSSILKAKPQRKAISAYFSKRAIFISSNVPFSLYSQAFRSPKSMISPLYLHKIYLIFISYIIQINIMA